MADSKTRAGNTQDEYEVSCNARKKESECVGSSILEQEKSIRKKNEEM